MRSIGRTMFLLKQLVITFVKQDMRPEELHPERIDKNHGFGSRGLI